MYLATPTLVDLLQICVNARDDEKQQYEAIVGEWHIDDVVHGFWVKPGVKFSLIDSKTDECVCIGGWEPVIPGVYQSWMVGTDPHWCGYWRSITKWSRKVMGKMFSELDARRLQTNALASRTQAIEWYLRGLKLKPEGIWRDFGLNGEDVAAFSRTAEDFYNGQ
jgi:hypothetical protein